MFRPMAEKASVFLCNFYAVVWINILKISTRVSQMKTLNIFLFFIMDDMVCRSMTHIQMCRYFIHCYAAIFLHDSFNCCNTLWCHYSVVPDQVEDSLLQN